MHGAYAAVAVVGEEDGRATGTRDAAGVETEGIITEEEEEAHEGDERDKDADE